MQELPKYLKVIFSKKDFKLLCSKIIKNKQQINDIAENSELYVLIYKIKNLNSKYNGLYEGGILYKMSNSDWIFFSENIQGVCSGYICNKNTIYSFNENYEYIISSLEKNIPIVSQKDSEKIKKLAMLGYSQGNIESILRLSTRKVNSVLSTCKKEIYDGFKDNFVNLVVENYGKTEQQIRAKSNLQISKKEFTYYLNIFQKDINKRIKNSEDLYINAIKSDWHTLEFMPEKYKTEENCLLALEQNVLSLKYIPDKYKTKSMCDKCMEKDIFTYVYVPSEFKTKENTELFFEKYKKSLEHIPVEYLTEEMCKIAFAEKYNNFEYIPNEFKTFEMCKRAVYYNGNFIAYVPEKFITEELCLIAVKQNGLSIKYVPDEYKQQNIIIEAVKQNYRAISLVTLQNQNDLIILIKNNSEVFKHLPPQVKNNHICSIALNHDIENIRYIPPEVLDEEMCKYFLRKIKNKKIFNKKQLINTIKNRLKILQIGMAEEKRPQNITSKVPHTQFKSQQPESYDDIINSNKYKNKTDLITIENSHDKIFNLTLIKNSFENRYTDFVGKLSNVNKNSSNLKIKTKYKDIYYIWSFRKNELEILLEFSNKNMELTKYFNLLEKELRREFDEILIVGQTKTKTVIYISTVKYSLVWAINAMYKFISILNKKLSLFYGDAINDNISEKNDTHTENKTEDLVQEYSKIDDSEENIEENDIFEEQEYVHLNIVDGQTTTVKLTRYERNPKNRAEAIKIHGTTCLACGFNFNEFYGKDLAKDFIEVHHIKPVSQGEYTVNPKTDLVPLCSNCHSMIHKEKNPPKTIEEIKNRYKRF